MIRACIKWPYRLFVAIGLTGFAGVAVAQGSAIDQCLDKDAPVDTACTAAAAQVKAACRGTDLTCLRRSQCIGNRALVIRSLADATGRNYPPAIAEATRRLAILHCREDPLGGMFFDYPLYTSDPRERQARALLDPPGKELEAAVLYEALWREFKKEELALVTANLYMVGGKPSQARPLYEAFFLGSPRSSRRFALTQIDQIDGRAPPPPGAYEQFADKLYAAHAYLDAGRYYVKAASVKRQLLLSAARSFALAAAPDEALAAAQSVLATPGLSAPDEVAARQIVAQSQRLSKAVQDSGSAMNRGDYGAAADALLADPTAKALPGYLCLAGRVLDRWNADMKRAKQLFKQCLDADPMVDDAAYFRARLQDSLLRDTPIEQVDRPMTYKALANAFVEMPCQGSQLETKGVQFATRVEVPQGYLFKSAAVKETNRVGSVEHEVRASKTGRHVFLRLTAKESDGCGTFLGFTWGDASVLYVDLELTIAPYPLLVRPDPAPSEPNPFPSGEFSSNQPLPPGASRPAPRPLCSVPPAEVACGPAGVLLHRDPGCAVLTCRSGTSHRCEPARCDASRRRLDFASCSCV